MTAPAPAFLMRSKYAAHRGVSPSLVTKWGQQGMLVLNDDGLVDVVATDAKLDAQLDRSRGGRGGRPDRGRGTPAQDSREPSDGEPESFASARAKREAAQAGLAQLELRKRTGAMVDSGRVTLGETAVFTALRQRIETLPAALAARLAAESDVRKCHALMSAEIRDALNDLSDQLEQMAASRRATQQ